MLASNTFWAQATRILLKFEPFTYEKRYNFSIVYSYTHSIHGQIVSNFVSFTVTTKSIVCWPVNSNPFPGQLLKYSCGVMWYWGRSEDTLE